MKRKIFERMRETTRDFPELGGLVLGAILGTGSRISGCPEVAALPILIDIVNLNPRISTYLAYGVGAALPYADKIYFLAHRIS